MIEYKIKAIPYNKLNPNDEIFGLYNLDENIIDIIKKEYFSGEWFAYDNMTWVSIKYDNYQFDFLGDETYKIEYYDESETLISVLLPKPLTLNDFIGDLFRLNIKIYWSNWVIDMYNPIRLIEKSKIENFIRKELNHIDKGFELL